MLRANLKLGSYPKPLERTMRNVRSYRRRLEQELLDIHGRVSLVQAHTVDEICAAEAHCGVARWILRTKLQDLSPIEILTVSRDIHTAKRARNKALAQLQLDQTDASLWDALDAPPAAATAPPEPEHGKSTAKESRAAESTLRAPDGVSPNEPIDVRGPLETDRPEPTA